MWGLEYILVTSKPSTRNNYVLYYQDIYHFCYVSVLKFSFSEEKNLWFNQRVNFKDATPEFERKSMKIWAINNYGRKEHANTPFNTPATLMHEQELPLITWGMIQLGYLMANVKDTWRYPAVQRGDK